MSGADIFEIIRRALEIKVREEEAGKEPDLVTTEVITKVIKSYERLKKNTMGFMKN